MHKESTKFIFEKLQDILISFSITEQNKEQPLVHKLETYKQYIHQIQKKMFLEINIFNRHKKICLKVYKYFVLTEKQISIFNSNY